MNAHQRIAAAQAERRAAWVVGLVALPVDGTTVLGQYNPRERWNGWLCPSIDALSVVQVVDAINGHPEPTEHGPDNGVVIEWHGADLLVRDLNYPDEPAERLAPDADGLYDLGCWGWTWESAEPRPPVALVEATHDAIMAARERHGI